MQIKIHDKVEQRSEEWFDMRKGKITASAVNALMAPRGLGKVAETYAKELISSDIYFETEEQYISPAMQNGIDLEPFAVERHEQETFQNVYHVGFISLGDRLGCSPDGLIGEDGGLEVKCPTKKQHFDNILSNECPSEYYDQVQFSLYVSRRKWWDVVSFNPNFNEAYQYKTWCVEVDPKWVELFEARLQEFEIMEMNIRTKLAQNLIIK